MAHPGKMILRAVIWHSTGLQSIEWQHGTRKKEIVHKNAILHTKGDNPPGGNMVLHGEMMLTAVV